MQGRAGEASFFDSEFIIKCVLINLFMCIYKKSNISCRVHVINQHFEIGRTLHFEFDFSFFFSEAWIKLTLDNMVNN